MSNETPTKPGVIPLWPDAAKRLGLGRSAVYNAVQRGEIPVLRFGRRIVVPEAKLDRMLSGEAA